MAINKTVEQIPGTKAIAQRMLNAENDFIETVMGMHGKTREQAEKVLSVYRRLRLVKLDAVLGRYTVKHGVYWDSSTINSAIEFQLS